MTVAGHGCCGHAGVRREARHQHVRRVVGQVVVRVGALGAPGGHEPWGGGAQERRGVGVLARGAALAPAPARARARTHAHVRGGAQGARAGQAGLQGGARPTRHVPRERSALPAGGARPLAHARARPRAPARRTQLHSPQEVVADLVRLQALRPAAPRAGNDAQVMRVAALAATLAHTCTAQQPRWRVRGHAHMSPARERTRARAHAQHQPPCACPRTHP